MSGAHQSALRQALLAVILPEIEAERVSIVEASVAAMGAMAVVVATLPPAARAVVIESLTENLPRHVDKRAAQIRSGEFDDALDRGRH